MDIMPTSNENLCSATALDYEHVLLLSLSDLKLEDTMHNPQIDDYITTLSPNKIIEKESFALDGAFEKLKFSFLWMYGFFMTRFTRDGILVEGIFWKDVNKLIDDYTGDSRKNK